MKKYNDDLNDTTKAVLKGAVVAGAFVGGTYATTHTAYADQLTKVSKLDNQTSTLSDHTVNLTSENQYAEHKNQNFDKFNGIASNSKNINLSKSASLNASTSTSLAKSTSVSIEQAKLNSLAKNDEKAIRNSGLATPPIFRKRYQH